jgi:histidinol dehydrogenase
MLSLFDQSTAQGQADLAARIQRLKSTVRMDGEQAAAVAQTLAAVRSEGDAAVVRLMRQWTDPTFTADRIRVSEAQLNASIAKVPTDILAAIERAIVHVREYQRHVMPAPPKSVTIGGAELGLRFSPVESAGLYVPGGTAVLFSTVIMTAVPALVAGVPARKLAVCCPPPTRKAGDLAGDVSPIVHATCKMLGIEKVYRLGGAQAIAAMAYGTETVAPVDFIAGPGNVFVALAKAQVTGVVGTEGGVYGPSEIVTVADSSARPDWVASDLLAQAEHNPGKCFVVAWDKAVLEKITFEVEAQLRLLPRREAIEKALNEDSCAVLVKDMDARLQAIAAEDGASLYVGLEQAGTGDRGPAVFDLIQRVGAAGIPSVSFTQLEGAGAAAKDAPKP